MIIYSLSNRSMEDKITPSKKSKKSDKFPVKLIEKLNESHVRQVTTMEQFQ
jgi:hypothetical protein